MNTIEDTMMEHYRQEAAICGLESAAELIGSSFFFRCNMPPIMDGLILAKGPSTWLSENASYCHIEYKTIDGRPLGCFLTFTSKEEAALFKLFWL